MNKTSQFYFLSSEHRLCWKSVLPSSLCHHGWGLDCYFTAPALRWWRERQPLMHKPGSFRLTQNCCILELLMSFHSIVLSRFFCFALWVFRPHSKLFSKGYFAWWVGQQWFSFRKSFASPSFLLKAKSWDATPPLQGQSWRWPQKILHLTAFDANPLCSTR